MSMCRQCEGAVVQIDGVCCDGEDGCEFMGDDDNGRAKTFAEFDNQIVKSSSSDWIESGRRFVEEQHVWIECHGASETCAFLHAARQFGRIEIFESRQSDKSQFKVADFTYLSGG